ncbi:hypothetical protein C453_06199 [Haloferax elongans ATCC BAA-1513]|uniref:DUF7979 domain-containing protein n=1 Tax=Haloferax elongans ATCC BAA-1513 TaxID=1230453 RepID=M0HSM8_HALEO|nr:hypothetical protein [Haloferax elongans]ELZ86707.1 hypothetical protein C453_06199 [Haloferax elongans ATCC BAA-1513]
MELDGRTVGGVVVVAVVAVVAFGILGGSAGTLTVEQVDDLPQGQGAVSFHNLDPDQREAFREALQTGGGVELPNEAARNEFIDPGYVRYDGGIYKTTVTSN